MKKVCWLLLFAFAPLILPAQYERILNNPDVIWAAEINVLYNLQPYGNIDSIQQNDIVFWKNFDPKNQAPHEGGELLIENILKAARSGNWPAWQSSNINQQLTIAEVAEYLDGTDTIDVMDVETGLHSTKMIKNEVDPAAFTAIKAKQLLYFDAKKGDFELFTSAIGPVRRVTKTYENEKGEWVDIFLYSYVPFWLKTPEFSKKTAEKSPKIDDSNIHWAAQIKTKDNSPEFAGMQPFKNFKPPVVQILLDRFLSDRGYKAQNALDEPIPFELRNGMISSFDTMVTFDPETYEEKTIVVQNTINSLDVKRLRLVENWFWDERKQRLVIRLARYAPLVAQYDNEGNYRFDRPLFFRTHE